MLIIGLNYEEIYTEMKKNKKLNLISLSLLGGMMAYLLVFNKINGPVSFLDLKYLVFTFLMINIFRAVKPSEKTMDIYATVFACISGGLVLLYLMIRELGLTGMLNIELKDKNSLGAILASSVLYFFFIHRGKYAKYFGLILYIILFDLKNRSTILGIFVAGIYYMIETYIVKEEIRKKIYTVSASLIWITLMAWWNLDFEGMDKVSSSRMSIIVDQIQYVIHNPILANNFDKISADIGYRTLHFSWLRPLFYGGLLYSIFYYPLIYINAKYFLNDRDKRITAFLVFAMAAGTVEIFTPFGTGSSFMFYWIYIMSVKNIEK
ncbi:MAG: hypothetical protein ACRC54_07105 [Fusobacteriaceae bacterium]